VKIVIDLLFVGLGGGCHELEREVDESEGAFDAPAVVVNT